MSFPEQNFSPPLFCIMKQLLKWSLPVVKANNSNIFVGVNTSALFVAEGKSKMTFVLLFWVVPSYLQGCRCQHGRPERQIAKPSLRRFSRLWSGSL